MNMKTLTVVGVGLIGGSIALAAKRRGTVERIIGTDSDQKALDQALAGGIIDEAHLELAPAVRSADVVVFCTPVDRISDLVIAAAQHCPAGALLTDAGSTKAAIVAAVEKALPAGVAFVGGHPLAGSEKRGPLHARNDLFAGRLVIITATPRTSPQALERTSAFWRGLEARVHVMAPEEHDRSLAFTSHLPQLVASALAGILPPELYPLTASGFRDTTRLAGSNTEMWVSIFSHNREAILPALAHFQEQLASFRQALEADDRAKVESLLATGKKVRDALNA